ncbi:MAG: TrmH family RNA methyltransferase [Chloroflexota bacterium]
MPSYQIRLCRNPECGLRYPLTEGHPFGERCPACLGETEAVHRGGLEREVPREADDLPEGARLRVLLDNLRSAWNVGSILRTADGFGFEHAYLCGITPTPEKAEVRKTALGAEAFVTWSAHPNALEQVQKLMDEGWTVLALEKVKASVPLQAATHLLLDTPSVLVLGNEVTGVDPGILAEADRVVHIPMRGQKRSFNVAVAFAIAAAIIHNDLVMYPWWTSDEDVW